MMAQHGHFYWNELMTRDPEAAKAFYGAQIGWRFEAMSMPQGGSYWICKDGDQPVAGILDMNQPGFEGIPNHWFAYLAVDDVDARVAEGDHRRRQAAAPDLRRPRRRPDRDHPGPDRRGHGLDHRGAVVSFDPTNF